MQVIVLADAFQKAELGASEAKGLVWVEKETELRNYPAADGYIDLLYNARRERNALLQQLLPKPVVVNSVMATVPEIGMPVVRINGWSTFLSSPLVEAAGGEQEKQNAADLLALLGKKPEWLSDEPGFITPRVVSMIINEAYLALAEGVSTKEEINTAMKLGTAYPFGPFEWAAKIGVHKIVSLLQTLSQQQSRYTPAPLLVQEALATS